MKIVAVIPMKLNNRRLPQKNTKSFTNGKPLCTYILSTLCDITEIDEIYVYCSNHEIKKYLPEKIKFLQRPESLDTDTTKMNEVLQNFAKNVPADIYVMTHTTAPFISVGAIKRGLEAVANGEYDSAFAVKKVQDFLWKDGEPFNYALDRIPRTQDLEPLYEETSGFYIYRSKVMTEHGRRIGDCPYLVEVGEIEGIDIDEPEDFMIADAVYNHIYKQKQLFVNIKRGSMNAIQILDCTLRDGGYCNQWNFGKENIRRITQGLVDAGVEIVECGFLTNQVEYCPDVTKYTNLTQAAVVIPKDRQGKLFVCMVNYGELDVNALPPHDGTSIDGIRVAFHKKDMVPALELCRQIQDKGYKVFIQAMVSLNYTDEEFLHLIRCCNEFKPFAFYIVDSFGVMKRNDLIRLFYEVEHNLDESIRIGYHSHNNMQLAYANAQTLVDIRTRRDLILDASIFGMGRGAGNLNTELITEYLNDNIGTGYRTEPLLELIDEIIGDMYQRNYWGYSLPNYLSAVHNAHPNYAGYLDGRKTLTLKDMNAILDRMEPEKKSTYDRDYIEQLYREHMEIGSVNQTHLKELQKALKGKRILLIAPGRSVRTERDKVAKFAAWEDVVSIGVNFDYPGYHTDYIFLSNLRRYRDLPKADYARCIVTSNVPADKAWIRTDYGSLTNDVETVQDNAGLMAINWLVLLGIKEIWLAGFDGYSGDVSINYADEKMSSSMGKKLLESMNEGMQTVLSRYSEQTGIHFLTTPSYITIQRKDGQEMKTEKMLGGGIA